MLTEKKVFKLKSFQFESGKKAIPVKIGYETYGVLNKNRDNAILICHYFTGTSHAAGRYSESEQSCGWWDEIIGPKKAIDTEKYFVICSDTLSNINFNNPNVVTTGPASIDPESKTRYCMNFPIFTLKDVVKIQNEMLKSLGITRLKLVAGPSMGGLQSFMWARHFGCQVEKIISVCATPMMTPAAIMVPNILGVDAIKLDPDWNGGDYYSKKSPDKGLLLAFKILLNATRTEQWASKNFRRDFADPSFEKIGNPYLSHHGRFLVETEMEKSVISRMEFFDANSYIYIAKANALFDLREGGETYESALSKIECPVLMIIDESDLIFTGWQAELSQKLIKNGETYYYDSQNGHLSCLFDTNFFARKIREFIEKY